MRERRDPRWHWVSYEGDELGVLLLAKMGEGEGADSGPWVTYCQLGSKRRPRIVDLTAAIAWSEYVEGVVERR